MLSFSKTIERVEKRVYSTIVESSSIEAEWKTNGGPGSL